MLDWSLLALVNNVAYLYWTLMTKKHSAICDRHVKRYSGGTGKECFNEWSMVR